MDRPRIFEIVLALSALLASAPFATGWQSPASPAQSQTPSSAPESDAQLRRMIDRGQAAEALKALAQLKSQSSCLARC